MCAGRPTTSKIQNFCPRLMRVGWRTRFWFPGIGRPRENGINAVPGCLKVSPYVLLGGILPAPANIVYAHTNDGNTCVRQLECYKARRTITRNPYRLTIPKDVIR